MLSNLNALVLNSDLRPVSCYPLSVWPFERAFSNEVRGRVQVLERHDVELRSQKFSFRPASVVMLTRYVQRPNKVPLTRLNVFRRDGFRCLYCNGKFSTNDLTFDHVIPRKDGGKNTWENLVSACMPCNQAKGHRRDVHPLVKPVEPEPEELMKLRGGLTHELHHNAMDYLYWSGVLDPE